MTIETKFNLKDKVWFIHDGKAKESLVHDIEGRARLDKVNIQYFVNIGTEADHKYKIIEEKDCFASREDLIASL